MFTEGFGEGVVVLRREPEMEVPPPTFSIFPLA